MDGAPWPDPAAARPRVWEVSSLLGALSDALQARFGAVVVRGELSGFSRAASGHCYFNLKSRDGNAGLRCAMFRRAASLVDFAPQDGQEVEVRGRLALYEPRGELQLIVEGMRRAGAGALMEQFLRLKARLAAEGLFDPAVKRPLPVMPQRIGIVTSLAAAALHDVASALARRAPQVELIIYPAPVQGAEAGGLLARAVELASARAEVDLLLLCRGGGSLEDLWAFNDERVVRAVAACAVPVVSGVGHETDFTLADFAADVRAPTPTAAAELAAPERAALLATLASLQRLLQSRLDHRLDREAQRLDRLQLHLARPTDALRRQRQTQALLAQRLERVLPAALAQQAQALARLQQRLQRAAQQQRQQAAHRQAVLQARLAALDPARALRQGYARVQDAQGRTVTSVQQLAPGQALTGVLADGHFDATVTRLGD
jgi:exodeoxyribonuclease VII large subunit